MQKQREEEINKVRRQNMHKWHINKTKEIIHNKRNKRSLVKKKKVENVQKH